MKPTGTSSSVAVQPRHDAIDQAAGDHRLADAGGGRPVRARSAHQVGDRHREVVIRVHQAGARGHDAVAVGVGVVGERDVEAILERDQSGHRVRRGAVHADLAVVIGRHEGEGGVDAVVDHLQLQPVPVGDRLPVGDARPAQRIRPQSQAGRADHVERDHAGQVVDVGREVVVAADPGEGVVVVQDRDPAQPVPQELVRRVLNLAGDRRIGRAAVGRVVLEPSVLRRVVRRADDDPVGARTVGAVVAEDRVRDRGRRREAVIGVDHHLDALADEDVDGGAKGRLGQGVRVAAEEQRSIDPGDGPVAGDRRADGDDVIRGEAPGERSPPVPGRAERHRLGRIRRIRMFLVVRPDEPLHGHQHIRCRGEAVPR